MSPATLSSPIKVHLDAPTTAVQEDRKLHEDAETKIERLEKWMEEMSEKLEQQRSEGEGRHVDEVKRLTMRMGRLENEMAKLEVTMQKEKAKLEATMRKETAKLKQEAAKHLAAEKQSLSKLFNEEASLSSLQPQIDKLNDVLAINNQRIIDLENHAADTSNWLAAGVHFILI